MRIISGKARGTKLYTLEGQNTRPTLDRVKESLFNIIQEEIIDSRFLDLFSGSGAIGLEAASRGAKEVTLCDKSKEASNIIKKNVEKTNIKENIKLYNLDYEILLKSKITQIQDIIYIDPPYKTDYAVTALKLILENKIVDAHSLIIIETDNKDEILNKIQNLKIEITDTRKYGRANLIFIHKI